MPVALLPSSRTRTASHVRGLGPRIGPEPGSPGGPRIGSPRPLALAFCLLAACPGATGTLDVDTFDCEAGCWRPSELEVPRHHWRSWLDQSRCDDGSITIAYAGTCVRTSEFCDSSWSDDPEVADLSTCCGGTTSAALDAAPSCGDTAAGTSR